MNFYLFKIYPKDHPQYPTNTYGVAFIGRLTGKTPIEADCKFKEYERQPGPVSQMKQGCYYELYSISQLNEMSDKVTGLLTAIIIK